MLVDWTWGISAGVRTRISIGGILTNVNGLPKVEYSLTFVSSVVRFLCLQLAAAGKLKNPSDTVI